LPISIITKALKSIQMITVQITNRHMVFTP
jgi:hypothetical protein